MLEHYILNDKGEPVLCEDIMEWARNFEFENRRVAETTIGDLWISTVFLGLNHNWGTGPPVLWEVMIFGPKDHKLHNYTKRCSGSREQALAMHSETVEIVNQHERNKSLTGQSGDS